AAAKAADCQSSSSQTLAGHVWPSSYKPIKRLKSPSEKELLDAIQKHARAEEPLVIEGSQLIDVQKWQDISHLKELLQNREVLVKRSPNSRFRYFDLKKNSGKYDFNCSVEETHKTLADYLVEAAKIRAEGSKERMYLQETLSGHNEMADEFASWRWEILIKVSTACGWGLPDSNELFVGMLGAETPLHFDERENLFFQ
ncbi:unnamed protein product, partial [Polarella glacialis]